MLPAAVLSSVFFSLALAASVPRGSRFGTPSVHESRDSIPHKWAANKRSMMDKSRIVNFRFALTQPNLDKAESMLMEVSHPDSPRYGDHLEPDEIADLFAPKKESVDMVLDWLRSEGLDVSESHYDHWKGSVVVPMPIEKAEALLYTTYEEYEHEGGKKHIACTAYSLPSDLREHVDIIMPTVHFDVHVHHNRDHNSKRDILPNHGFLGNGGGIPKPGPIIPPTELQPASSTSNCNQQITPACLRALYNVAYTQKATSKNSFGIVAYTPQAYIASDLDLFAKTYNTPAVGARPDFKSVSGGFLYLAEKGFLLNGESNLDLQYGMAMSYPLKPQLYQVGDTVEFATFNTFLDAFDKSYCATETSPDPHYPDTQPGGYNGPQSCGTYTAPKVISTSYGYDEVDLTPAYEQRQCNEYMKLGLAGTTFVFSSGDYGVAGNGGNCLNGTTGIQNLDPNGIRFNPAFPSTCPWVTSVGATEVAPGQSVTAKEVAAAEVIKSGGGFSNRFAKPSYQSQMVSNWWANHNPHYNSSQHNTSKTTRGYPDIAANGVNYVIAVDGQFQLVYGTSASAPTMGGIFSLLNDARLAQGKKSIGFANPVLYANSGAFHDIVSGNNAGCGTNGYSAVTGWDPVTGLGTPKFDKLLAVFKALK